MKRTMIKIFTIVLVIMQLFGFKTSFCQSIDTLKTYTSLQIYSAESDTIYMDHPRYYGHFIKDTCTSENFAITVQSKGSCYRRIANNLSPRFLEIGRASPLPILGGTMTKEVDAINGAAYIAFQSGGDTILIDSLFLIDRPIYLFDNNTYLGTTDNAGFIRIKPPVTILSRDAATGDNKIIVESTEGFRKSQNINIFSGSSYDELSSFTPYSASVSTFLGGDTTIFLSGLKVQKPMLKGDTVSLLYSMMLPLFGTTDNVNIENLIFDGNRKFNRYSYDWRVATTIVTPSSQNLLIKNCHFQEIQSENIFLCGAKLIDCTGQGFNGSAAHFSCQEGTFETEVLYNKFSNKNEIGDSIMEHSEASLTFSAKVQNLRVAYNIIDNIQEKGIGNFANDDFYVEIADNLFNSTKEKIGYIPFYEKDSLNLIYNNKNLKSSNTSSDNCMVKAPQLTIESMCSGDSSIDNPLKIGDTITITFDSLKVINTNENYLKCLEPIYSEDYFSLESISLKSKNISSNHK